MRISVILSTYNRPKALQVVLDALGRQDDHNFEVIIADDGSGTETRDVVNAMATKWPQCNIQHVWHEKKGFRLARIRNLACKVCTGKYLVFLDGDCVPPPDFVSKHRTLSKEGWAVYGQRILANKAYTEQIEENPICLFSNNYWTYFHFFLLARRKHINRASPGQLPCQVPFGATDLPDLGKKYEVVIGQYGVVITKLSMEVMKVLKDGEQKIRILRFA